MERAHLIVFGQHIKNLRLSKSMTQWDVACKGNFDRNYIGMLERGERNPSLLNLMRLAEALEVSLPELINFKD